LQYDQQMTAAHLNQLLLRGEGKALDYKAKHCRIAGGEIGQRAEFVKDVLAMANSWRHETAYIILGGEQVAGSAPRVVGLDRSIDDATCNNCSARRRTEGWREGKKTQARPDP
jgi:hypothetical protein